MKLRRRKRGKNIIHFRKSLEELASDLKTSRQDLQKRVETIRRKLFGHREKRIQPGKDGKATAYVCINYKCELPSTDISKMLELLSVK